MQIKMQEVGTIKMNEPKSGEKYRHFKGGEYEIICIAKDCDNPEKKFVVYKSLYSKNDFPEGTIWIRELSEFLGEKEINERKVRRFVKI
jgi:hypothetical protein